MCEGSSLLDQKGTWELSGSLSGHNLAMLGTNRTADFPLQVLSKVTHLGGFHMQL